MRDGMYIRLSTQNSHRLHFAVRGQQIAANSLIWEIPA